MSRWIALAFVTGLLAFRSEACPATDEVAGEAAEVDRERAIAERFLELLARNPREGTSFDRVYGFFAVQGNLDKLAERYRQRTTADERDGAAWMIVGLIESRRCSRFERMDPPLLRNINKGRRTGLTDRRINGMAVPLHDRPH